MVNKRNGGSMAWEVAGSSASENLIAVSGRCGSITPSDRRDPKRLDLSGGFRKRRLATTGWTINFQEYT